MLKWIAVIGKATNNGDPYLFRTQNTKFITEPITNY
jgi:hypothetical protein